VQDDEFAHLRGSVRRSTNLRVAPQQPHPRIVEPFAPMGVMPEPRRGLSFWQITLRAIPIVAALVSTSLLVYFMFFGRQPAPYAPQQQERPAPVAQPEPAEAKPETPQRVAEESESPKDEPAPPIPIDLGPKLPMPSDDKLVILITSSVLALNQANATNNYTVLRAQAAPAFQRINSSERLSQIFGSLRARNLDLSPVILYTPKLFRAPEMNAEGMIRITGFFPTEPERVNFDVVYQPVQGKWRLFGIAVETGALQPPPGVAQPPQRSPATPSAQEKPTEDTDTEKPPVPARKAKAKPKAAPEPQASNGDLDVRDRLEQAPATPPAPEKPKQKSIWNPFGR
jgi:hypothetical protein